MDGTKASLRVSGRTGWISLRRSGRGASRSVRFRHLIPFFLLLCSVAIVSADQLQNSSVQGDAATLAANGYGKVGNIAGTLNGELVNIGVIEAGGGLANVSVTGVNNTAPNTSLMNGNPDLPSLSVQQFQFAGNALPAGGSTLAGTAVGDHATEVTGVVVGQGRTAAADTGIASGSTVYQAGIPTGLTSFNTGGSADLTQQSIQRFGVKTVNMSFGSFQGQTITFGNGATINSFTQATNGAGQRLYVSAAGGTTSTPGAGDPTYSTPQGNIFIPVYTLAANGVPVGATNNGNSFFSEYVDWQASSTNTLMVVAGNEGPQYNRLAGGLAFYSANPNGTAPTLGTEFGAPSDAYNILNVAATGVRTSPNAALNYDQASSYNTTNATADGRIGVDMVAPGGDPFSSFTYNLANYNAYLAAPNNVAPNANTVPVNGFISQFKTTAGGVTGTGSDTFNGMGPVGNRYSDITTASSYLTVPNPGILTAPGGSIAPTTDHGTSFAAPLVSGASAVIDQYGLLASVQNVKSTVGNFPFSRNANDPVDHRVLKAILMNGASKYEPDGNPLTRTTGTPWTASAPSQGAKALPAPLAALAVGPQTNTARSGLDPQLGSGQLNVLNSLNNYSAGEQGPGAAGAAKVMPIGWDYENVPAGSAANTLYTYNFTYGGGLAGFQATLAWDAPVNITGNAGANDAKGNATFQPGTSATSTDYARGGLTDLDLYFFQVNPNGTLVELGSSNSNIDNVEHIYDQPLDNNGIPTMFPAGNYQLDVIAPAGNTTGADVPYGVAWTFITVPEPTVAWVLLIPAVLLVRRDRASGTPPTPGSRF